MHHLNNLHKKKVILKYVAVDICWLHSMSVVLHWFYFDLFELLIIFKKKRGPLEFARTLIGVYVCDV